MTDPMVAVARRLGTTPGQAWTLALGLGVAVLLLGASLPPVLEARGALLPSAATPPAAAPPAGSLTGLAPSPAPSPAPAAVPAPPAVDGLPAPAALPALPAAPPGQPLAPPVAVDPAPVPTAAPPGRPPGPGPTGAPTGASPTGLALAEAGYSTDDPASPALPPDGLPVSARLRAPAEVAHVRLTGAGDVLALRVDSTVGSGEVQACVHSTADWTAGRPQARVPFDPAACVTGVVSEGVLRFDLAGVPARTARTGLALAPVPSNDPVPSTFRLVLRPLDPGAPS